MLGVIEVLHTLATAEALWIQLHCLRCTCLVTAAKPEPQILRLQNEKQAKHHGLSLLGRQPTARKVQAGVQFITHDTSQAKADAATLLGIRVTTHKPMPTPLYDTSQAWKHRRQFRHTLLSVCCRCRTNGQPPTRKPCQLLELSVMGA
jgi:hypothetical protein